METETQTIPLIDQIRASRKIYEDALTRIEELTDSELGQALRGSGVSASAGTVARVLSLASAGTVARVLSLASDDTVDRVLSLASDDTVARVKVLRDLAVPVIADLDHKVLKATENGGLDMGRWHCGTTHCRAGWAITLADEAGAKLEAAVGSELAGRWIYEASTGRVAPDFFASNTDAMADIRRCAGVSKSGAA